MVKKLAIVIALSLLPVASTAGMNEFDSCRCNNGIASKGDSKDEVVQECGRPVRQQHTGNYDCREMWIYNFGPNEFMQGICFDSAGQVKKVISLNYGY